MGGVTPLARLDSVGLVLDGRAIVKTVSMEVYPGEVLALVGPNGAGKTTLFSIILGDAEQDSGLIELERDIKIGFLPQESAPTG